MPPTPSTYAGAAVCEATSAASAWGGKKGANGNGAPWDPLAAAKQRLPRNGTSFRDSYKPRQLSFTTKLRRFFESMAGAVVSKLILLVLVVHAYWEDYVEMAGGQWWRLDLGLAGAVRRTLRPAPLRSDESLEYEAKYYIEHHGYHFEEHKTITDDGFVLTLYRVNKPGLDRAAATPMIIQHGLFQSSGIFVCNERESLAFYMADRGYDVFLGNNRCKADHPLEEAHVELRPDEHAFWNWSFSELARFDFPAIVRYVSKTTQAPQRGGLVYVGHSQGNAAAFAGLGLDPSLNDHIRLFIALAPAVRIGPFDHWALRMMSSLNKTVFRAFFGLDGFIPIMWECRNFLPCRVHTSISYHMFNYLFNWTHDRWCKERKVKYFKFTPRPTSAKLVFHWCTQIIHTGRLADFVEVSRSNPQPLPAQHEIEYQYHNVTCPTAFLYGKSDSLVHAERFAKELRENVPTFDLRHIEGFDKYEHLDLIWSSDAHERVYPLMHKLVQKTV